MLGEAPAFRAVGMGFQPTSLLLSLGTETLSDSGPGFSLVLGQILRFHWAPDGS